MKAENHPRSILRLRSVLKGFTPDELELTATDISRKAEIPKTTTHRMLAALTEGGLLERNAETGKYTIGPELYMLGSLYLSTTDMLKAAEPVLKTLTELTGEATNMAIFDKGYVVVVMQEESKYDFKLSLHVGSLLPAYASAMGKALLSELTDAELDSLYPEERLRPITRKTIPTKTELKLELQQIRRTGVVFNREGAHEGVEGIGSAIRDASGRIVAAMSISVPIFRMNQGTRERLTTLARLGSDLISYRLGYRDTANPVRDIQQIHSWWEQNSLDSASQANSFIPAARISHNDTVKAEQDL